MKASQTEYLDGVLCGRYDRINSTTWRRVGKPSVQIVHGSAIDSALGDLPSVTDRDNPLGSDRVEVRILARRAILVSEAGSTGEIEVDDVVESCDELLKERYPGSVVVENLSEW